MSSEARHMREESPDIQLRFIGARVVGNAHRQCFALEISITKIQITNNIQ